MMGKRFGSLSLLFLLLLLLPLVGPSREPSTAPPRLAKFPDTVQTINGKRLDLTRVAARKTLVVVTLKASWCPVCQNQLMRIKRKLPEIEGCGVTFLVLAPGPRDALRAIQEKLDFPYPFVEDGGLAISKRLGLQLAEHQIFPSILILNPDLSIGWIQRGRNASYYGDRALIGKVNCGDWI